MATLSSPYEVLAGRGVAEPLAREEVPLKKPNPLQGLTLGGTRTEPTINGKPAPGLYPLPGSGTTGMGPTATQQPSGTRPGTPSALPARPMGFGGINFTPFGPNNTLRAQQITPQGMGGVGGQMSQQASRARDLASADLEGLGGPDRASIASSTLQRLIQDTEPAYQKELRGVGQKAAALGRLGSGMTTSDLGDVSQRRNQAIVSEAGRLADQAAGQTLGDRLDVFGARNSAARGWGSDDLAREDQSYRQGRGIRDEYRGERDYQDYMARSATDDQVRQLLLEDQMLNSSFNRDQSRLGTLSTGFGNVPTDAYGDAADRYGELAGGNLDTVAQLMAMYGQRRA